MSATTIPAPSNASGLINNGLRIALVSLAIVVLLAVSFVSGRATGSTTDRPATVTPGSIAPASAPAGASMTPQSCHMVPDC